MFCGRCKKFKSEKEFSNRSDRNSKRTTCSECRRELSKLAYKRHKENSYFKLKANRARSRSQHIKVPCNLTAEYLESIWTEYCPVLGIKLIKDTYRSDPALAELDRFIPNLGYIEGNVTFVSHRANVLKNNATIEEMEKVVQWMSHSKV